MNAFRYTLACRELPGDLHTPVSAYLRLRDASTRSILMESSDFHAGREARSFIALEPLAEVGLAHGTPAFADVSWKRPCLGNGCRKGKPP